MVSECRHEKNKTASAPIDKVSDSVKTCRKTLIFVLTMVLMHHSGMKSSVDCGQVIKIQSSVVKLKIK